MIYLARDDVIAAMAEQIGEAAVGYITVMSASKNISQDLVKLVPYGPRRWPARREDELALNMAGWE
jgi:hypothetical protein